MTQLLPTLHERGDVIDVLTEILRQGRARPGVTLVGVLDFETRAVLDVRRLATPEPLPDDACDAPGELSLLMSPTLCALAQDVAPPRHVVEGFGWAVPDRELVTVVCRDGELATSPTEEQFFWGWRYSNHLTMALHGDVYVVTPTGWAGLLGGSGALPVLPTAPAASDDDLIRFPELEERRRLLVDPAAREAAAVLAEAALSEMVPDEGECLVCYEVRLVHVLGCNRTLRIAQRFRDAVAPRARGLEKRLARMGIRCDCQLSEAYGIHPAVVALEDMVRDRAREAGEEVEASAGPPCLGVDEGSTEPCLTWVRWPKGHKRRR